MEYRSSLAELREIRQFVERESEGFGLSAERVFNLKVAVSEACANAIEHSANHGGLQVNVKMDSERLMVEILHAGRLRAIRRTPDHPHRGLGLPLMAALVDQLTITRLPTGGTSVRLSMFRTAANHGH